MNVQIIENHGPDNLRDTLKSNLESATTVWIAVAFVSRSGLEAVAQRLGAIAARNGQVRLLTGLYQKVTEPAALRMLLLMQQQTKGRLAVKLSRDPQFHRKVYIVRNKVRTTAIVGSSNLTDSGLRSGGELNLMVHAPTMSALGKRIEQTFASDWDHHAVTLQAPMIDKYEKARPTRPVLANYSKGELKSILGVGTTPRTSVRETETTSWWRDGITGFVDKRTETLIAEATNWDDMGYEWYGAGGPHRLKIGDRLVLFNFADREVCCATVKQFAKLKGQQFVAYQTGRPRPRRMSKALWAALKEEGLYRTNTKQRRKLSAAGAERLVKLFK